MNTKRFKEWMEHFTPCWQCHHLQQKLYLACKFHYPRRKAKNVGACPSSSQSFYRKYIHLVMEKGFVIEIIGIVTVESTRQPLVLSKG